MGWTYPEVDAVSLTDFGGIVEQWKEAGVVESGREQDIDVEVPTGPREVSEEEFRRIAAAEQGFAEKHGKPKNPFH